MGSGLPILLLGGSGFVGSALLREFARMPGGSVRVRALLRTPAAVPDYPFLEKIEGSLESAAALQQLQTLEPDAPYILLHFAIKQIDSDHSGFGAINVDATAQLLGCLSSSLAGVIYGSSMSVYGQGNQDGVSETQAAQPETALALSRHQAEQIISHAAQARNIPAWLLRPRFVLGQGDRFVLPGLCRMVQKRMSIGNGQQRFSIIDVADYARIIIRLSQLAAGPESGPGATQGAASQAMASQRALHVGYASPLSLNEITQQIRQQHKLQAARVSLPAAPWLRKLLRLLPGAGGDKLATQIELIGLPHWGKTDALQSLIGPDLLNRNPLAVLAGIIERAGQQQAPPN
jgi:nucleoside-diphosphate-sugar epimerase